MSLLRPATPRLTGDRRTGKPGEVSCLDFFLYDCLAERDGRFAKYVEPKTIDLLC